MNSYLITLEIPQWVAHMAGIYLLVKGAIIMTVYFRNKERDTLAKDRLAQDERLVDIAESVRKRVDEIDERIDKEVRNPKS